MKKKWIVVAVIVLMACVLAGLFLLRGETPTPIPTPTPTSTAPATTPGATPTVGFPGVIEITAEKLAEELMANPNKYKEGTVFQVSGVKIQIMTFLFVKGTFFFGPASATKVPLEEEHLVVIVYVNPESEKESYEAFNALRGGDQAIIRGTYSRFYPPGGSIGGPILKNVSLVSVTPAK